MRKFDKIEQEEASTAWLHLAEQSKTDIKVESVHIGGERNTESPMQYSWSVEDGMIRISFDFGEAHSGYFIYSYEDGQEDQTSGTAQTIVNNYINCTGGGSPSGSTF